VSTFLLAAALMLAGPQGAEVAGETYHAVVGETGNLQSLRIGATEALEDFAGDARGAVLREVAGRDDFPVTFEDFAYDGRVVSASRPDATLTYHFYGRRVRLIILNTSPAARHWELTMAAGWSVDGRRAGTPWGANLDLASDKPTATTDHGWRVTCPSLDSATVVLTCAAPPAHRPFAEAVWAEPRSLTPGRFVLHARPPDTSPDGRFLNLPLALANDGDAPRNLHVRVDLGAAHEEQDTQVPARAVGAYDARLPAPEPGAWRVTVTVSSGGEAVTSALVLAFAPERWPVAATDDGFLLAGGDLGPRLAAWIAEPGRPVFRYGDPNVEQWVYTAAPEAAKAHFAAAAAAWLAAHEVR
jgi:hypothetical protein